ASRVQGATTATTTFAYDETSGGVAASGHLTSVVDSATGNRQEFTYDAIGRATSTKTWLGTRIAPYVVASALDTLGRVVTLTYPDLPSPTRVRYSYAADGGRGDRC